MLNLLTKTYIAAAEILTSFMRNKSGVTAVEYALAAAALATLLVFVFMQKGSFIYILKTRFEDLAISITTK